MRDDSRRESEGCPPDFEIPLESPFAKVGTDEEVQQDAAGVWGVPRFLLPPPKSGGQGVDNGIPGQLQKQLRRSRLEKCQNSQK